MHKTSLGSLFLLVGRVCISAIFVYAGYMKIGTFSKVAAQMAAGGLPYSEVLLVIAIILELGGALLVFFGFYARFGALMLIVFIIPVTYLLHGFWGMEGTAVMQNMQHFMKNLSMLGGLLYVLTCGAGRLSIDGLFRRHRE